MPPARRAAGTQWPKIAGHAAGTGGPQPLCLGPCQGGRAGGRCVPGNTVCGCAQPEPADPAHRWLWYGCDGWARWCSRTGRCRWCWVGAASCERLCTCQPGPATPACPSPGRLALSLPLCPQSAPCSASGSSSPRWAKIGSSSSSWGWSWRWSAGPWTSPSPPASKVSGHCWVPGAMAGHGVAMPQGRAMPLATRDPPGRLCPQPRSGCMGAWTPTCCSSTWPGSPTPPCSSPSQPASPRSLPPRPWVGYRGGLPAP